ncbi:hypothetical protein [Streptomyces liangshanensis]|uniref:hypothetical protein n=1 Tax=Streptomyces liangshanensis TaxID=2717324 RepID=UPI0036D8DDA0
MSLCAGGGHDWPIEDDAGACCPHHGLTLLYRGDPVGPLDLTGDHWPSWCVLGPAQRTAPVRPLDNPAGERP